MGNRSRGFRFHHNETPQAGVSGRSVIIPDRPGSPREAARQWRQRRMEPAETNRLNHAHWRNARGESMNEALSLDIEEIWKRCEYEARFNEMVDGVIFTHQTDVVGPQGPKLRVHSKDRSYSNRAEKIWKAWFAQPTLHPKRHGATLLRLWIRNLWVYGEYLAQKVTDQNAPGPVKMRLNPIGIRRLCTPAGFTADPDVVLGIRVKSAGNVPTQYYITNPKRWGPFTISLSDFTTVPADLMIHGYQLLEEDQVRGYPWLAPCLNSTAATRDYEDSVLEAARTHADQAVYYFTRHPEAQYYEVNEYRHIQRGSESSLPPGWEPYITPATQPSAQYQPYIREQQRKLGRPKSMPLMAVRLDSSEHNYSSARFDGQIYLRALQTIQFWLSLETLNPLVNEVFHEAELTRELPPQPEDVTYSWIWPTPPHVDPKKEADAETVLMRNGTLPYSEAVAAHGRDPDEVIKIRQQDNERLEEAGLPTIPGIENSPANTGQEVSDDDRAKILEDVTTENDRQFSEMQGVIR